MDDDYIERLAVPADRTRYATDPAVRYLRLRVTPAGTVVFYTRSRTRGHETIGHWPAVSLAEARRKALELRHAAAPSTATLGDLYRSYMRLHLEPRASAKHLSNTDSLFRVHLAGLADRRAASITPAEMAALHLAVAAATSATTANKVRALVRSIYAHAVRMGEADHNPGDIPTLPTASRARRLDGPELGRFIRALRAKETPRDLRDMGLLALFTGLRRGNLVALRWDWIDGRELTVPASQFKSHRRHTIPLVEHSLSVLNMRASESQYVFPARGSAKTHRQFPYRAWRSLCARAGVPDLRPHDLRRTLGSVMADTGAPEPIIARMLGHKLPGVTSIYTRVSLAPVREALNRAVQSMLDTAAMEE